MWRLPAQRDARSRQPLIETWLHPPSVPVFTAPTWSLPIGIYQNNQHWQRDPDHGPAFIKTPVRPSRRCDHTHTSEAH